MSLLLILTIVLVAAAAFNLISFGYSMYAVKSDAISKSGQEIYTAHQWTIYATAASQTITLIAAIGVMWLSKNKQNSSTFR
jgi:hypothetical protein